MIELSTLLAIIHGVSVLGDESVAGVSCFSQTSVTYKSANLKLIKEWFRSRVAVKID